MLAYLLKGLSLGLSGAASPGPVLVKGWKETPAFGLGFLFGFYFAIIGGLTLLVVLFGAARRLGPRVNRVLLGFSALALLGFGLYQLWHGLLA